MNAKTETMDTVENSAAECGAQHMDCPDSWKGSCDRPAGHEGSHHCDRCNSLGGRTIRLMTRHAIAAALLAAGALALALPALDRPAPGQAEPAAETARMERVAQGRLSYRIHCASCHGESGRGDGPLSEQHKVGRPT